MAFDPSSTEAYDQEDINVVLEAIEQALTRLEETRSFILSQSPTIDSAAKLCGAFGFIAEGMRISSLLFHDRHTRLQDEIADQN